MKCSNEYDMGKLYFLARSSTLENQLACNPHMLDAGGNHLHVTHFSDMICCMLMVPVDVDNHSLSLDSDGFSNAIQVWFKILGPQKDDFRYSKSSTFPYG